MRHTRHRSLTIMRSHIRRAKPSQESSAGKLGLWRGVELALGFLHQVSHISWVT